MKNYLFVLIILIIFTLMSCSQDGLTGEKPPKVNIKIGNEKYETVLGTYCWKGTCADTAGPLVLLEGKETIKVQPGEKLSFKMDYEPKPNEFQLVQISESIENEVLTKGNSFSAPTEKGNYYYSYGVWWMDEKEENLSHGDAFYAFALEVR